ncbi:MAG: 5'-nucleotidase C-terminal domain-containing protein [Aliishimia sp.]
MNDRTSPATFLRILATSDLHMHLVSHDYYANSNRHDLGLQALSGTIKRLRLDAQKNGGACLLVDNGDLLQGTPLGDHLVQHPHLTSPHPVAKVMDAMGYDVLGLGNHDLDYGLPYLAQFARSMSAPLLSSNTHLTEPTDWLHTSTILPAGSLKVGVLSVLPTRTSTWVHSHLFGIATFSDMEATVSETASRLRKDGADLVLALAHTGIGTYQDENALSRIAASGDVDALVGGHTHVLFPDLNATEVPGADMLSGHLHGIPTIMPGFAGEVLGCIDLHLVQSTKGTWNIQSSKAHLAPAQAAPQVPELAAIAPAHRATCAALDEVLGETCVPLTSYFALVQPTPMLALIASAKMQAIDLARQGTEFASLPLLAATSPDRAGGHIGAHNYADIPSGPLQRRQIAQMHVFPNDIWGVPVSGLELRRWLERSATIFTHPLDLSRKGLLSHEVPPFDFDIIFGVTYGIDPTSLPQFDANGNCLNPNTSRIEDLRYQGQLIRDQDRFFVATKSYRACGGGYFPGLTPERTMLRPNLPVSQVVQDFVQSRRVPKITPPWRMSTKARGLKTWFETGPGAIPHLNDIAGYSPETPIELDSGFLRIPITL